MIPEYIEQINKWPRPTNRTELRSFLGKVSYYRTFLGKYSVISSPLERLRSEKVPFTWGKLEEEAFKDLKAEFYRSKEKGPLGYPNFGPKGGKFILDTDWSKVGVAAELSQVDENGNQRVVAMAHKKNTPGEANYSPSKGEYWAGFWAMRKFEHILRFKKFTWRTDCKAWNDMQNMKDTAGRFRRIQDILATFDFDVQWRPGSKHANVDIPSRAEHSDDYTEQDLREANAYVYQMEGADDPADWVTSDWGLDDKWDNLPLGPDDADKGPDGSDPPELTDNMAEVLREQEEDKILSKVRAWVTNGLQPTRNDVRKLDRRLQVYRTVLPQLVFKEGLLYRREDMGNGDHRLQLVIPDSLREKAFEVGHSHRSAGHPGLARTMARLHQHFYWPDMMSYTVSHLEACHVCQRKRPCPPPQKFYQADMRLGSPNYKVSLDLVGPLMPSGAHGDRYILTILDNFTRFFTAVPIPNKEAATVAKAFSEHYIAIYGCPVQVLTDNGREFNNGLLKEVLEILEIQHTFAPPYAPRGNRVERWHRTLTHVLKALISMDKSDWADVLPWACFCLNTSVCKTTGATPFSLQFGREANVPLELVAGLPPETVRCSTGFAHDLDERLRMLYEKARRNIKLAFRRAARIYSSHYEGRTFEVKDKVWYYCPARKVQEKREVGRKFFGGWVGPFQVEKKISDILYMIKPDPLFANLGKDKLIPCVVDRLAHYRVEEKDVIDTPPIRLELADLIDDCDPNGEFITPQDANATSRPLEVTMKCAGWDLSDKLEASAYCPTNRPDGTEDPRKGTGTPPGSGEVAAGTVASPEVAAETVASTFEEVKGGPRDTSVEYGAAAARDTSMVSATPEEEVADLPLSPMPVEHSTPRLESVKPGPDVGSSTRAARPGSIEKRVSRHRSALDDTIFADIGEPSNLPTSPTVLDEFETERYYLRPRRMKRGAYNVDSGEEEEEERGRSWFRKRGK